MTKTAVFKKDILKEDIVIPEIQLQCPSCKVCFNIDAMHRIYRAYLVLTRHSREQSFNAICSSCGKHTQIRIRPLHPDQYKCRRCLLRLRIERENLVGYKPNPSAYKRI